MAVKVIVKGKEDPKPKPDKVLIAARPDLKIKDNIIIRVVKIMVMDIRMRFNPALKEEYGDYARFCDLARGKK
jgi:hypothetical protein